MPGFDKSGHSYFDLVRKEHMKLQKLFLKLIVCKNSIRYILVILSIIISYLGAIFFVIYIDNVLLIYSKVDFLHYRYIFNSIRAIFILSLLLFLSYQYNSIIKVTLKEYRFLYMKGMEKQKIRILMFEQIGFLLVISIAVGLYTGNYLSCAILSIAKKIFMVTRYQEVINSNSSFYLVAGIISIIIIGLAIDGYKDMWKSIDIEEGKRHYIS